MKYVKYILFIACALSTCTYLFGNDDDECKRNGETCYPKIGPYTCNSPLTTTCSGADYYIANDSATPSYSGWRRGGPMCGTDTVDGKPCGSARAGICLN